MSRLHLMFGVAMLAMQPAAAMAQDTPAPQSPTVPPIDYSLPPGANSVQPVAPPPVIVTPTLPKARPTPKAIPTPTPTPRTTARPEPTPTPKMTPTPEAEAPTPSPTPSPIATPAPVSVPSPAAPVEAATSSEAGRSSGGFNPLMLLLALGPCLLAFLLVRWWMKRREETAVAEPEPVVEPAPVPEPVEPAPAPEQTRYLARPAPPPAPPVPAGTITAFKDRPKPADPGYITAFKTPSAPAPMLGIEVNPIRAGIAEDAGFVEFQFAMINPSDMAVGDMLVSAWILSANPDQDAQILANLSEPADPTGHNIYSLRPGEHREHQATLGVPMELLHVVEAAGRRFFAPILLLDARYRAASGAPGRTSAAYMIGRPNPATGKLAPIYVDRGPRAVDGLAARPYPIAARN